MNASTLAGACPSFADLCALADALLLAGALPPDLFSTDEKKAHARAVVLMTRALELGLDPLTGLAGLRLRKDGSLHVDTGHLAALLRRPDGRYAYDVIERGAAKVRLQIRERDETARGGSLVRCEGGCVPHLRRRRAEACAECGRAEVWQTPIPFGWRWLGDVTTTLERAKAEGAAVESEVWRKHPEGCLMAKALREGARRYCPDVLPLGFGSLDEDETADGARALEEAEKPARQPRSSDESSVLEFVEAEIKSRSVTRGRPIIDDRVEWGRDDVRRARWADQSWLAFRFSHRASEKAGGEERWKALDAWPSLATDAAPSARELVADALTKPGPRGLLVPLSTRSDAVVIQPRPTQEQLAAAATHTDGGATTTAPETATQEAPPAAGAEAARPAPVPPTDGGGARVDAPSESSGSSAVAGPVPQQASAGGRTPAGDDEHGSEAGRHDQRHDQGGEGREGPGGPVGGGQAPGPRGDEAGGGAPLGQGAERPGDGGADRLTTDGAPPLAPPAAVAEVPPSATAGPSTSYTSLYVALSSAAWEANDLRAKHGDASPIYLEAKARTDAAREALRAAAVCECGHAMCDHAPEGCEVDGCKCALSGYDHDAAELGPNEDDDAGDAELRETSARVDAGEACPSCFGVLVNGKCLDEGCDVDDAAEWLAEQERVGEWTDEPALEGRDPRRDPFPGDVVEVGPLPGERLEVLAVTRREPQEGAHPSHEVRYRAGGADGAEHVQGLGAWRSRFNALVPAGPDRGRVIAVAPGRGPIEEPAKDEDWGETTKPAPLGRPVTSAKPKPAQPVSPEAESLTEPFTNRRLVRVKSLSPSGAGPCAFCEVPILDAYFGDGGKRRVHQACVSAVRAGTTPAALAAQAKAKSEAKS